MKTKADQQATMNTRLHEWGTKLDGLMAEVGDAAAGHQGADAKPMADLKAKLQEARSRIDALNAADGEREVMEIDRASFGNEPPADDAAQPAAVLEAHLERRHEEELDDELEDNVARIEAQMLDWSNRLNHLVADALKGGSQSRDAYRVRIDDLRAHLDAVQVKLTEVKRPEGDGVHPWSDFHASIQNDWIALEDGFQGLVL